VRVRRLQKNEAIGPQQQLGCMLHRGLDCVFVWSTTGLCIVFIVFLGRRRAAFRCSRGQMRGMEKGGGGKKAKCAWQSSTSCCNWSHHHPHTTPPFLFMVLSRAHAVRVAWGASTSQRPPFQITSPPPSRSCLSSFCGGEDSTGGGQEGVSGGAAKTERARRQT